MRAAVAYNPSIHTIVVKLHWCLHLTVNSVVSALGELVPLSCTESVSVPTFAKFRWDSPIGVAL